MAQSESLGQLPDSVRLAEFGTGDAADVEVVVLAPPAREEFARRLPELAALRVVQLLNAGTDWVPSLPPGVVLCNSGDVHSGPVAEWVVAAILAMRRGLVDFARASEWDANANTALRSDLGEIRDLDGATVLIVGEGSIGAALRRRLEPFGSNVTGVARTARAGRYGPGDLPGLLPTADVVVLLTPLTDDTRGLVDAGFLALMPDRALLVNAARGALVDTEALVEEVRSGRIRAVLDATDPEPLPAEHPLWTLPGTLVTPHVAGSVVAWRERAYRLVGDQLRALASGRLPAHIRNHGY